MKLRNTPLWPAFVAACAQAFANDPVLRADSQGSSVFLARELEFVSARTYDVLYKPIKGRQIVPFNYEVSPGAESFSYDQFDQIGLAEWVTNYGDEPPRADAFKKRFTRTCHSFWSFYAYTIQDIRAAAMGGTRLDAVRARTARLVMERFLDDVIATGDTTRGVKGLCNNTDIPEVSTLSGAWDSSTTGEEFFGDLNALVQSVELGTGGLYVADTLVLPLSVKPLLSAPFAPTYSGESVLSVWLKSQEDITKVIWWNKLDTASAIGGPRALTMASAPEVLEFVLSQDYEEFPPEVRNLETKIVCHARVGGVSLHYPIATGKMDLDA